MTSFFLPYLQFQSTLSLRRATNTLFRLRLSQTISIHALLAESDCYPGGVCCPNIDFNPRSPCGERPARNTPSPRNNQFQSTLSLRRATRGQCAAGTAVKFQSTLSLRRATCIGTISITQFCISIHALLAESDLPSIEHQEFCTISIHALLAESDLYMALPRWPIPISIHALLAESDMMKMANMAKTKKFQSTLSLRRATEDVKALSRGLAISIHALLAESDP